MFQKILPIFFLFCFAGLQGTAFAQPKLPVYKIKGTVYDSTRTYPLQAVSVMSTSGKGTITDIDGHYLIEATDKDSIWFSYLGKPTMRFPVARMNLSVAFDIALQVNVPELAEVRVKPRNYRQDSIQNRQDYAKVFNYRKPGISPSVNSSGVGFDLDEIINMFRFKRNRSMLSFQRRLISEEQEKFVKHRFSKGLVRRLTQLDGDSLDYFMQLYVPSYIFTLKADDYTYQKYIKDSGERFKKGLLPVPAWRQEEEEER